jgi:tetratricopeptide (TPR) repeat protein
MDDDEVRAEMERRAREARAIYDEGKRLAEAGKHHEAIEKYGEVFKTLGLVFGDQFADIMGQIAACHANLGEFDLALERLRAVEELLARIRFYREKGPDFVAELGHEDRSGWPDSVTQVLFVDDYNPACDMALICDTTARVLDLAGRRDDATAYFQRALENARATGVDVIVAQVLTSLAYRHSAEQDWVQIQATAGQLLNIAIGADNLLMQIAANRFLAQAHVKLGKPGKAREHLRAVVAIGDTIGDPRVETDRRNLQQLESMLAVPDDVDPNDPHALLQRGRHFILERKYEQALADADLVLKLDKNAHQAWVLRSNANMRLGRSEEALADANRAIELDPTGWKGYLARGIVYEQTERFDEAFADYNRAIELDPEAGVYNNRGVIHLMRGDADLALADFQRAIELKPDHANAHFNLGGEYKQRGELRRALVHYDQAANLGLGPAKQMVAEIRARLS